MNQKKKKIMTLFALAASLALCKLSFTTPRNIQFPSAKKNASISESSFITGYSQIAVNYYNLVADQTVCPTKNFDTFLTDFYSQNQYGFSEYLSHFASENHVSLSLENQSLRNQGRTSKTADYILSQRKSDYLTSYTDSDLFVRKPAYRGYSYGSIQKGDILIETRTTLTTGHAALIANVSKGISSSTDTYIQTIEAVSPAVSVGFLDDWRRIEFGVEIYRPKVLNSSQIDNAIAFAANQLGEKYSIDDLQVHIDDSENEWYCSELVYAAYKNYGLDISTRKNSDGSYTNLKGIIYPGDITVSCNVSRDWLNDNFLDLSVVGKSGSKWKIKISNKTNKSLSVSYNSKRCFLEDAKNWNGLKDLHTIQINGYSSANVEISTNWFATSIAVSYTAWQNGKKNILVTYADSLDSGSLTLSSYKNSFIR